MWWRGFRAASSAVVALAFREIGSTTTVATPLRQLLALQQVPLLRDDQHCAELVPANLVESNMDGQLECAHQIERAPDKQALLRALRRIQPVERAVVATMAILVRRVRAQAGIAQFVAPQRPMHQESEGRIIRPLPR